MSSDMAFLNDPTMDEWYPSLDNYQFDNEIVDQQVSSLSYSQEVSSFVPCEAVQQLDISFHDEHIDSSSMQPIPPLSDTFSLEHHGNSQSANETTQPNSTALLLDRIIDVVDPVINGIAPQFDESTCDYNQVELNGHASRNSEILNDFSWMMPMDTTSNAMDSVIRFTELSDDYPSNENQGNSITLDVAQRNEDITMRELPTYGTFRRSEDIQLVTVTKRR